MTEVEKLDNVEHQVRAIEAGKFEVLVCPYCGMATAKGDDLCCDTFNKALHAVLDRIELQEKIDAANRIAERAARN